MRHEINFFVSFMILVILGLLGAIIGYKVGFRAEYPPPPPTFWELLKSPVKFSGIFDANNNGVLAQTTNGKLYYWDSPKWVEADSIPNDGINLQPMKKSKTCSGNDTNPPGKVVECALIYLPSGGAIMPVEYALLEDGTIWKWAPQFSGTDMPLLSIFICPSIGILLGVIAAIFFIKKLFPKVQIF